MPESHAAAAAVLAVVPAAARRFLGARLASVYALGSLAHGGFSAELSDVDVALIVQDPLQLSDESAMTGIKAHLVDRRIPLAERLSLFWGSPRSLREAGSAGRFPPLDRLDLILHGRLLAGRDLRAGLPAPGHEELVVGAVQFALQALRRPQEVQEMLDPALLVRRGARQVSKRVLFPVRFLYTARTGQTGRVEAAAEHYHNLHGSASPLVAEAVRWRSAPPADAAEALGLLRAQLLPLYFEFLDDHLRRMEAYQRADLCSELAAWRRELAASNRAGGSTVLAPAACGDPET